MTKPIGLLHPTDGIPTPSDQVTTFNMTGGSSAQASDWLSTGSTAASQASQVGIGIVRFTGMTTAGAALGFDINLSSTGASVGSNSGTSVGSTGGGVVNCSVIGQASFQVPGGSTGYSVSSLIPGYIRAEVWRK